MDSQHQQQQQQRRVSVTVHQYQQTQSELTDYPSLTDSQMSSVSAHVNTSVPTGHPQQQQQQPRHHHHHHHQSSYNNNNTTDNNNGMTTSDAAVAAAATGMATGRMSRLEDSATQTQVEDGGSFFDGESVSRTDTLIHYTATITDQVCPVCLSIKIL